MDDDKKKTIFIDVLSAYSVRPLADLVGDVCKREAFPIFQYDIGKYLKLWKGAKVDDHVVYSIDQIALCHGKIRYVKSMALRPLFFPDHQNYQTFVNFASALCSGCLGEKWNEFMIQKHVDAIEKRRWLFVVFAMVEPTMIYTTNRSMLQDKIRQMDQAEAEEKETFGICPLSD